MKILEGLLTIEPKSMMHGKNVGNDGTKYSM